MLIKATDDEFLTPEVTLSVLIKASDDDILTPDVI